MCKAVDCAAETRRWDVMVRRVEEVLWVVERWVSVKVILMS